MFSQRTGSCQLLAQLLMEPLKPVCINFASSLYIKKNNQYLKKSHQVKRKTTYSNYQCKLNFALISFKFSKLSNLIKLNF